MQKTANSKVGVTRTECLSPNAASKIQAIQTQFSMSVLYGSLIFFRIVRCRCCIIQKQPNPIGSRVGGKCFQSLPVAIYIYLIYSRNHAKSAHSNLRSHVSSVGPVKLVSNGVVTVSALRYDWHLCALRPQASRRRVTQSRQCPITSRYMWVLRVCYNTYHRCQPIDYSVTTLLSELKLTRGRRVVDVL
ncbi:hypothetical protein VTO42DRAFT_3717 [Malbranchea cinnamomea]